MAAWIQSSRLGLRLGTDKVKIKLDSLQISKKAIVLGKGKSYFPGNVFATCSIAMRGERISWGGGWDGVWRAFPVDPFYLFQTPLVSHYSCCCLRGLTHWNPVKVLRQQHRQTEKGKQREEERRKGQESKQRWDKTLVLLSGPFFLSVSDGGCYPNPPLKPMNNTQEEWVC